MTADGHPSSGANPPPGLLARIERAYREGRPAEAAALCDAALADDPRPHALHNARAAAKRAAGDPWPVGRGYARAIALAPSEPAYYVNLANALMGRDRPELARRLLLNALRLRRDRAEYQRMLAECLIRERRPDLAGPILAQLASARPYDPEIRFSLGNLRLATSDPPGAARALRRCLALAPGHARACMNLATAVRASGDVDGAIAAYEATLLRDPGAHAASYMRANALLGSGRLADGWDAYEARWLYRDFPAVSRRTSRPVWDGDPRRDTTMLVWPEQGLGDVVRYASCLPDLLRTGQRVIVECDPRLVTLFRLSFPAADVRPVSHDEQGRELPSAPDYDHHLPIASLPRFFRRSLEAFPARRAYLFPPADALTRWRGATAALGPGIKVGVSWRSGIMTGDRSTSYADLEAWRPIFAVPGVVFVNLQHGTTPDDRAEMGRRFGLSLAEWPSLDLRNDLTDLAALVCALDVVIAGTSSVSEIAGAVGAATWVYDGPPVYVHLGSKRMPWHPSWRLFARHSSSETWDRVFAEIASALRDRARCAGR
ncbi:MAG: tetratricopeptide repeat protein [Alphaproteobacteria bacterium]|nr:tetratricopeptide repeat protein [Alphaproteobacteria bacterium]